VTALPIGSRRRAAAYWLLTTALAWELGVGALSDLLRLQYVREIAGRLGYPLYLLTILGVCKLLASVTVVAPGLRIVKEWAYAGCVFVFGGASVSHLAMGSNGWWGPLIGVAVSLASWALRPPSRRLEGARSGARPEQGHEGVDDDPDSRDPFQVRMHHNPPRSTGNDR
jgi:hypothetical protein